MYHTNARAEGIIAIKDLYRLLNMTEELGPRRSKEEWLEILKSAQTKPEKEMVKKISEKTKPKSPAERESPLKRHEVPSATLNWIADWIQGTKQLDIYNALPVLKAVTTLNLDALQEACVTFIHENISAMPAEFNWDSFEDHIIRKLAKKFNNLEIDAVGENMVKLTDRLFKIFTGFLVSGEIESRHGHYYGFPELFKCSSCNQVVNKHHQRTIRCVSNNVLVTKTGLLKSYHEHNADWEPSVFVKTIERELQMPRYVYWRVWGTCHFLCCRKCKHYFPLIQSSCCQQHPFDLDKLIDNKYSQYPCCGDHLFLFEPIQGCTGCKYLPHCVSTDDTDSSSTTEIYKIFRKCNLMITIDPPKDKIQRDENIRLPSTVTIIDHGWFVSSYKMLNRGCKRRKANGIFHENWDENESVRNNQDRQRDEEEKLMVQLGQMLLNNKNLGLNKPKESLGGSFLLLEQNWLQAHQQVMMGNSLANHHYSSKSDNNSMK